MNHNLDPAETDYYRQLLRNAPAASDVGAHLVWVRLLGHVLSSLDQRAPNFTLALCSEYQSTKRFIPYCRDGYERKYTEAVPHAFSFLTFFLNAEEPEWLKDLARCEVWLNRNQFTTSIEQQAKWRNLLGIRTRGDMDFVTVSHDITVTMQEIIGYRETTMCRVAPLLWTLGVSPIRLIQRVEPEIGLAIFANQDNSESLRFVSARTGGGQ